jgi:hypothetical protein
MKDKPLAVPCYIFHSFTSLMLDIHWFNFQLFILYCVKQ